MQNLKKRCFLLLFAISLLITRPTHADITPTQFAGLVASGVITAGSAIVAFETIRSFIIRTHNARVYKNNPLISPETKDIIATKTSSSSQGVQRYLSVIENFPWKKTENPQRPLAEVETALNATHHGLDNVKKNVLSALAAQQVIPEAKAKIICLAGPAGVGKTTIAQSIAKALGRGFCTINTSLGEESLRGIPVAYANAEPGEFTKALIKSSSTNPVILLDEVDKASGAALPSLLEALDPERNKSFFDAFLGFGVDLSETYIIATANSVSQIPVPLRDRMEIININAYTAEEKAEIGRTFLLPKVTKDAQLPEETLTQLSNIMPDLIALVSRSRDSSDGVRSLERSLKDLVAQEIKHILTTGKPFELTKETLKDHLDPYHTQLRLSDAVDIQTYCNALLKDAHIPADIFEKVSRKTSLLTIWKGASSLIPAYIEYVVKFPFNVAPTQPTTLDEAESHLNRTHTGLHSAKEAILDYITGLRASKGTVAKTFCLVGMPGVGKTTLAQSIATALGRKCFRIPLGTTLSFVEGAGKHEGPGLLARAFIETGIKDPIIILDELETMAPALAAELSELLDTSKPRRVYDKYLGFDVDLSQATFIATATSLEKLSYSLRKQIQVITLRPYSTAERTQIAKEHLIPDITRSMNLSDDVSQHLTEMVEPLVATMMPYEGGVHGLKRALTLAAEKYTQQILRHGPENLTKLNAQAIIAAINPDFLQTIPATLANTTDCVGIANGMYASGRNGGGLCKLEAIVIPNGSGELKGNKLLGDQGIESRNRVFAYIKSIAHKYGINPEIFKTSDFMFGDQDYGESDGPSAGIVQAAALISAITGRTIKQNFATTGAIDMHGNTLPVGGYRDKILGSHQKGIQNIIVPECSRPTIEAIRKDFPTLNIFYVSTVPEALDLLLNPAA